MIKQVLILAQLLTSFWDHNRADAGQLSRPTFKSVWEPDKALSLLCSVHCAAVIGGRVNLILLDNWSLLTVQKGNNPWVEDTLCHETQTPAATLLSPYCYLYFVNIVYDCGNFKQCTMQKL